MKAGDLRSPLFHSVRFTDREGNLLQEVLSRDDSRTLRIPIEGVSPYFLDAITAAEDGRFREHDGVDYRAVLRAAMQNLRAGRVVSGGSTITLQLARMINPSPRTFRAKAAEVFSAWRIEAGMSKDEILEAYVNRLPMGGNIYGIEAGARTIFGVSASDLSLAQASFLAAIPNSPTRFNPFNSAGAARARQRHILSRMVDGGTIDSERGRLAGLERLRMKREEASFLAPHFVFRLYDRLPPGARSVRTTLDSRLQMIVARQVRQVVEQLKDRQVGSAAALVIENFSGEVLAYVGSADFFDVDAGGQNDGVQALRQPGSTLKPFLYSYAFERGFTPASLLADVPTTLPMPRGSFRPQNYSETFRGPVRAREALAGSLNVPAIRLVTDVGVRSFLQVLRSFGFSSLDRPAEHYGAGIALGDGEVRLWELAAAYLALSSGGYPVPLRTTFEADGDPLVEAAGVTPEALPVDPRALFLTTDILADRFARAAAFGTDSVLALPFPCAVKTGTSFRFADNWTVGYSSEHTVGVWAGNFSGAPMQGVSGVSGAGPLFARIMTAIYDGREEPAPFRRPAGLVEGAVCSLSGMEPTSFCPSLVDELFLEETAEGSRQPCTMHHAGGISYPPPFRSWALRAGLPHSPHPSPSEMPAPVERDFTVLRPGDGSVYRRLPDLEAHYQSLRFELQSPTETKQVRWLLDGEIVAATEPPHTVLWNVEPGNHVLHAEDTATNRRTPPVHFTVH